MLKFNTIKAYQPLSDLPINGDHLQPSAGWSHLQPFQSAWSRKQADTRKQVGSWIFWPWYSPWMSQVTGGSPLPTQCAREPSVCRNAEGDGYRSGQARCVMGFLHSTVIAHNRLLTKTGNPSHPIRSGVPQTVRQVYMQKTYPYRHRHVPKLQP